MNPAVRVEAHENRLCEETEQVYNEDFFTGLTAVVNALDNVAARTTAFVCYYCRAVFKSKVRTSALQERAYNKELTRKS